MTKCPICKSNKIETIYQSGPMPIFQNKVYRTQSYAKKAKKGTVTLSSCMSCQFIYNSKFNPKIMDYDQSYHNEQDCSKYYKEYINVIINFLIDKGFQNKKIVEIGCGKGYFLNQLTHKGFKVIGFDPVYEGGNKNIIKDYFSSKYSHLKTDLIILRHTLEHIENPFNFLQTIAKANLNQGKIFIEVPDFEWIKKYRAFWDIFYEHCNYFNNQSLKIMFRHSATGRLFNGQYLYLLGDLEDLKKIIPQKTIKKPSDLKNIFEEKSRQYQKLIKENINLAIWGAGAKGTTFLNILDKNKKYIELVIDINPVKQNKFIAGTGHKIVSPGDISDKESIKTVLVMNPNYFEEIKKYQAIQDKKVINIEVLA